MKPRPISAVTALRPNEPGDRIRRYRLRVPQVVQMPAQSLRRWGQCAPIVVTMREEPPQVLDGSKRRDVARPVRGAANSYSINRKRVLVTVHDAETSAPLTGNRTWRAKEIL